MNNIDKLTKKSSNIFIGILNKYIEQSKQMNHYLELEEITTNMIEELREKCLFSLVNGLDYYIIQVVKDLKKYDKDCKDFIVDNDRLMWVKREVNNNKFDFDCFQANVKSAMSYTQEHYKNKYTKEIKD